MPRQVTVSSALVQAMRDHAIASLPREACGLLAAAGAPSDGCMVLLEFLPQQNLDPRPDRFAIDPVAIARADHAWRRAGLRLGGVFHSHPGAPPRPSRADAAAAWPELVYLILGLAEPKELTAWRRVASAGAEPSLQPLDLTVATLSP